MIKTTTTYSTLAALVLLPLICAPAVLAHQTSIVKPVFYVPTDKAFDIYHFHNVQCGLVNVERWYSRELPNDNVLFDVLLRYYGNYTSQQCINNMGLCIEDVKNGTGIDPWYSGDHRNKLLIIGRGFLGWAGGTGDTQGRGYAVVGAESLIAQSECAGNWWCTEEFWNGTVIHELGHTFSLPHSSDPNSIMYFHGDYKNKHLTGSEPGIVESDWATTAKGSNWTRCENDYQCVTRHCGCNGSNTMYCLPHSGYPNWCSNVPNWEYCRHGRSWECASNYCAPDWKGDSACLPHTGYVYCWIDIFYPEAP